LAERTAAAASTPTTTPAQAEPARSDTTDPSEAAVPLHKGADTTPAPRRNATASRFESGWVYLGEFDGSTWITRYFDGWSGGLPESGTKITPRGRSYVRLAIPDENGALAGARTTIGSEQSVAILELARWQNGPYVWARAEPAW
jgi:hypothetical protein